MDRTRPPQISVIVYTYNHAPFIAECLQSVLDQTLPPEEIVVCDDCSTDHSWEIIQGFAERYPGLIRAYRHAENRGMHFNANFGLRAAHGEWITSLGGDDCWLPGKLEMEWQALARNPAAMVAYSNVIEIDEAGRETAVWYDEKRGAPPEGDVFIAVYAKQFYPGSSSVFRNPLFHRRALDEAGYYDEEIGLYLDWDYKIRLTARYPVAYSGAATVKWRVHPGGVHNRQAPAHAASIRKIYEKNYPLLAVRSWDEVEAVKQRIADLLAYFAAEEPAARVNGKPAVNLLPAPPARPQPSTPGGEKSGENLIFLISQPRAGSTMLQRILGSHSQVHTASEPWLLLHPLYGLRGEGQHSEFQSELAHQALEDFLQLAPEGQELYYQALRRFGDTLYDRMLELSGKRYFLDKTPRYYLVVPELYRLYPQAKFIFLLRNPLAVLASIASTWYGDDLARAFQGDNAIDLVKGPPAMAAGLQAVPGAAVVHYEDLVRDPQAAVSELCARLEIPFEEAMIQYGSSDPLSGRMGDPRRVNQYDRPVADFAESWVQTLSGDVLRQQTSLVYLERMGAAVVQQLGYDPQAIRQALASPGHTPAKTFRLDTRPALAKQVPPKAVAAPPAISVVTPSYNQGQFIEETILSVLNQGYPAFEHIVIDGGSTDQTLEVLEKYPHLRWISEPDGGQTEALNKGMRMAGGDWIAWINSDDIYLEGAFQALAEACAADPQAKIFIGDCQMFSAEDGLNMQVGNHTLGLENILRYWDTWVPPTQPAIFFKRELLEEFGYFDEDLHYAMDYEFWLRAVQKYPLVHLPALVAGYRFHGQAKSNLGQDWSVFFPEWKSLYRRYQTLSETLPASPLLSVIVPLAQREYPHPAQALAALRGILDQLLTQKMQELEVLVLTDHAGLEPPEAGTLFETRFVHLDDLQPNQLWQPALVHSRGFALFFCLPGSQVPPEFLPGAVSHLLDHPGMQVYYRPSGSLQAWNVRLGDLVYRRSGLVPHEPLFSVIIPTYNRSEILHECLSAVAHQQFAPGQIEVLVCDDGSPDDTPQVVESFFAPFRLKYLRKENGGPAGARNMGLREAVGKYVLFLNDDAILDYRSLAVHAEVHAAHTGERLAVLGKFTLLPEYVRSPFGYLLEHTDLLFNYANMQSGSRYDHNMFYTCNLSLRRELVAEVGGFDEDFHGPAAEDIELGYRLGQLGLSVYYDERSIAWHDHRQTPEAFCRTHQVRGFGAVTLISKHPGSTWYRELDQAALANWRSIREEVRLRIDEAVRVLVEIDQRGSLPEEELQRLLPELYPLARQIQHFYDHEGILANPEHAAAVEKRSVWLQQQQKINYPLVTVVIPCYNYAHLLPEAVRSVVDQTYPNWELVIVNDGSPDDTLSVAEDLIARYPQHAIRLIDQPNSGQPAIARNRGIVEARGEFILPLDADDRLAPTMLESCAALLVKNPQLDIVYPDAVYFEDSRTFRSNSGVFQAEALRSANQLPVCSMYRRRVWETLNGYRTNVKGYEDWDFWLGALEHGFQAQRHPEPLFYYRSNRDGLYAQARQRDRLLRAQIVLNHPGLYSPEQARRARQALVEAEANKTAAQAELASGGHILLVAHAFGEQALAGTELYTYHLAREFIRRGLRVTVACPRVAEAPGEGAYQVETYDGIPVVRVNLPRPPSAVEALDNQAAAAVFGRVLADLDITLVHFQHLSGFSPAVVRLCAQRGLPTYFSMHDAHLICDQFHLLLPDGSICSGPENTAKCAECKRQRSGMPELSLPSFENWMAARFASYRGVLDDLDGLIVPSSYMAGQLHAAGFEHPAACSSPLGLYPFSPKPWREKAGQLRIAYFGSIVFHKGLDVLLKAYAKVRTPATSLHVFGKVYDQQYFQQHTAALQPDWQVNFYGAYRPEELPALLAAADVAVIPSRAENYPTILRECLHANVPVICAEVGAAAEILADGVDGFLFPPGDVQALAELLDRFIHEPGLAADMRRQQPRIRTIAEDADHLLAIYQRPRRAARPADQAAPLSLLQPPAVEIVIPVYGQVPLLEQCVQSLFRTELDFHLTIVDDCSPGEEMAIFCERWSAHPQISLLRTPENVGFIGACRLGAENATAPFILFLNSDVQAIQPGWLQAMLPAEEDVAVVGARLLYPPGFPAPLGGSVQHAGVARDEQGVPYHPFVGQPAESPLVAARRAVNAVTGACFLVRRSVWEALGGWDNRFGRGVYEDVDFCWRARQAGYQVIYEPQAVLYHHESASKTPDGQHLLNAHTRENLQKLIDRWQPMESDEYLFLGRNRYEQRRQARAVAADGFRLLGQQALEQARRAFERALEVDPELVEVLFAMGRLAALMEDDHEAVVYLQRARAAAPTYWQIYLHLAEAYARLGETARAEEILQPLLLLFPEYAGLQQRASRLVQTGEPTAPGKANGNAASRAPERVFNLLLAQDDLLAALDTYQADLTPELLQLIQARHAAALANGQGALAAGLQTLSRAVRERLSGPEPLAA